MAEELAKAARAVFEAGVRAADPADAVRRALATRAEAIAGAGRIHLIAAGKAAVPMMRAALDVLPRSRIAVALAVTNDENLADIAGATVLAAGHPLPDRRGAQAAEAVEAIAARAAAGELVLCLISGGASAMLPAPVPGVSLEEKIATSGLLLRSGADIVAMNTVRKALSRLKGGGLARAIAPARGLSLILSDVPGDDLGTIASGPTVIEPVTPGAAFDIVQGLGLLDRLPASVAAHLAARPTPMSTSPDIENVLIGSNRLSLRAMEGAAAEAGFQLQVLSEWLEGDVEEAARAFAAAARTAPAGRIAVLAGGETSVHVTGSGKGGRNQELALRVARILSASGIARPWAFLSGGTDGRDGPTDAAGGEVTAATLPRLAASGLRLDTLLANNDAYRALEAAGGLLMTGATGTNVADLQVLLLG